jgi:hypothetical protein
LIKLTKCLSAALLGVLLVACGSHNNGGGTAAPANFRFVNASQDGSLTVAVDGTAQFSNVPGPSTSDYASVVAGTHTVTVTGASGSLASPAVSVSLNPAQTYSLVAYVRDGAVVASLVTESQAVPASGDATLGVANLSPDSGGLDLYLVAPGTPNLAGLAPTFQSASYRAAPTWATFVAGTFDIVVTAAGNPNDVRQRLSSISVSGGQISLLAVTSTSGGALVNAALLTQAGAVQFVPATSARVRVVSALSVSSAIPVTATVGTTSLAPVFAPNPGTYTLVAGNATAYAVSAAGAPIAALPAATFATGGDFTVLVYGAVASPSVSILTDINQQPIVAGDVNLRLVNAGVNDAGGLTLYDNNVQVASSVAFGTASSYFGAPSANSVLELVEPAVAPLSTSMLLGPTGSVYSVFVIDATLTPYVIRDR